MKSKKIKKEFIIGIIILIVIILIIVLNLSQKTKVGKIKNGKAIYIDRVVNVSKNKNISIEFKNNEKLIDNCIMTSELYDKFKDDKSLSQMSVKEYLQLENISDKEKYNINKSIQLKLINEDTKYTEYFAMTCGFKSTNELLKYTKAVIDLANKESK